MNPLHEELEKPLVVQGMTLEQTENYIKAPNYSAIVDSVAAAISRFAEEKNYVQEYNALKIAIGTFKCLEESVNRYHSSWKLDNSALAFRCKRLILGNPVATKLYMSTEVIWSPDNQILIKYFSNDIDRIDYASVGSDWIDLRAACDVKLSKGETGLIPLGVGMKLPNGYEAIVAPRSSTLKNFHIMQTNSIGIIDNSYSGNEDEWKYPVIAVKDTEIKTNDRICQFRILKNQPKIEFHEVEVLDEESRGGFGSTGVQ